MRTVVPFDHQGRQPFLRRPHMVGHDRDGIVEPHDLAHALDGLGRRIVHALHPAAEDGRLRQGRDLHARRPDVDAVDGRSVDLRRRVEALRRRADQLELLRPLERHVFGDRHAGRIGGELAIGDPSARRRVKHFTALRAAGRGIDVPAFAAAATSMVLAVAPACAGAAMPRGSRSSCRSPARPARDCRRASRSGGACSSRTCGRSTSSSSAISIGIDGVGALAHLDIGHGQDDPSVAPDADEGVGREAIGAAASARRCERQAQAQHQASARGRSDLQEAAPGETAR